jgi:hypothetical protein
MKTLIKKGQNVFLPNGKMVIVEFISHSMNAIVYYRGCCDIESCIVFRSRATFFASDLFDNHDEFGPDDIIVQTFKHDGTMAAFELLRHVKELTILDDLFI